MVTSASTPSSTSTPSLTYAPLTYTPILQSRDHRERFSLFIPRLSSIFQSMNDHESRFLIPTQNDLEKVRMGRPRSGRLPFLNLVLSWG